MKLKFYSPSVIKKYNGKVVSVGLVSLPLNMTPRADCLIWSGTLSDKGYGRFWFAPNDGYSSKYRLAHRMAAEIKLGRYLRDDEHACHECDVPACVNPSHIFIGTNLDNIADKMSKGRNDRILTENQVFDIMRRLALGEPARPIARELGVHFVTISDIKCGRSWAHIAGVDGNPTVLAMQSAKPLSKMTAKLDERQAMAIKMRLKAGHARRDIASDFGVTVGTIAHIANGRTWGDVKV